MKKIVLITTGGTIAMSGKKGVDSRDKSPSDSAPKEICDSIKKGLKRYKNSSDIGVKHIEFCNLPSPYMDFYKLRDLKILIEDEM